MKKVQKHVETYGKHYAFGLGCLIAYQTAMAPEATTLIAVALFLQAAISEI